MADDKIRGFAIMTASNVGFTMMGILMRMTVGIDPLLVALIRFAVGSAVILGLALPGLITLRASNWRLLVVRGLVGSIAVLLFVNGIQQLGLGKGTVLNNTYPIFAALLSPILLKERLHRDLLAAVAIAFMGIVLLVRPGGSWGVSGQDLLALLGGALAGLAIVIIKQLRETDSSAVIFLSQCLGGIVLIGPLSFGSSLSFSASGWIILGAIGITATVAQLLMTYAYKLVPATEGSLISFLAPVLSLVAGILFFGESLRIGGVIGSLLVLGSCAYVALRERILPPVR